MSAPDAPNIFIRPKATDGTLEFYWQPGSSNGSPITSYTIDINGTVSNLDSNDRYYKAELLTNKEYYSTTIFASNGVGAGPAASFRTVQPGLKPEQPTSVSLYRLSELGAKLSWYNQSAANDDSNIPTPWRNVIVAPRLINGKFAYAGDDSVTSNAKSVFGNDTSGNILVGADASYNFIVRAANDPGYSLPYNGTGAFSLKQTNYTGESFLNWFNTGNFQNRANYFIKKRDVGPVQNADQSTTEFNYAAPGAYSGNQRGFIVYTIRDSPTYDGPVKVLDKHGFVKFSSPSNIVNASGFINTRTNPIVPMFSQNEIYGTATSNLPFTVYDYNTNTSLTSTIQEAGQTFGTSFVRNNLDNNVFIALNRSGAYDTYVIQAGSKVPVFKYRGYNALITTESSIDKEMFVFQNNSSGYWTNILYIPNSGTPVMYDISGLNMNGIYDNVAYPLSSKKVVLYGSNTTDNTKNIYTFDFNGSPSYTKRIVSLLAASLYTSNSFSNFYQARNTSAVSFVDNSGGDGLFAISPLSTTPALGFTGTGQTIVAYTSNSKFTGSLYSNDTTNFFFTGVGLNGGANTKEVKYGPLGGPYDSTSLTGFTYQYRVETPHYSLFQFYGGPGNVIRPWALVKYNTGTNQFDVSGVDLSGSWYAASDNSGVNFISVESVNKTYKYSTTLWPPVEITPFMGAYYGTYPRSAYTFCIQYNTYNYYIYNGATFDSSGTVQHAVNGWIPGPDCLYAMYADGTNVYATRISVSGAVVYQTHPFSTDVGTVYGAQASPTGFICKFFSSYNTRMVVDFDTNRNTFNFTLYTNDTGLPSHNITYSTYLPNIEAV